MKEIIAVIRPEKWPATREAVKTLGVSEVCHQRVLGRGRQGGLTYLQPGSKEGGGGVGMLFLTKRIVVWTVADKMVNKCLKAIIQVNQSGNHGDGKVFVCPLERAVGTVSGPAVPETGAVKTDA